jgi:hypothetical protein
MSHALPENQTHCKTPAAVYFGPRPNCSQEPERVRPYAAIQLVDRYDLRAAASFQLAAALEWCEYTLAFF